MYENTSHSFKSISHPIRVQILLRLSERLNTGYQFSELSRELAIASSSKLSFHLDKMKDLVFVNDEGRYTLTEQENKAVQAVKILGVRNKDQGDYENVTKSIVENDGTDHGNKMAKQINAIKENYVVRSLKKYRSNSNSYVVIWAISLFIVILTYGDVDFVIFAISFGIFFSTLIASHRVYKPPSKIAFRLPAILYILGTIASEGQPETVVVVLVLTLLLNIILLLHYNNQVSIDQSIKLVALAILALLLFT